MSELKPCPCGKVPAELYVTDGATDKWAFVSGDCCDIWSIEFRTQYTYGRRLQALAEEAWNAAPRAANG